MNESETEMTEQPLIEPAVQPAPAVSSAEEMPSLAPPAEEEPRVDNNVPLPMVKMPPGGLPRQWTEHEYEMIHAGLMEPPPLREPEPEPKAEPLPEQPPLTETAEPAPEAKDEAHHAAMEAYWKTALTGNPDSIPDSFRARAASSDITSSAEESEYDLLSAVNRSWYADHSELSREKILAEWPRLRAELSEKYGVADNEREIFTALSVAPEEEARREAAKQAYAEAYQNALLGKEVPKSAPWEEDANPWVGLQQKAREEGARQREELLPEAKTLSTLFSVYNAIEKGMPWEAFTDLWDAPEMVSLCRRMVQMDPQKRQTLYDLTLHEMEQNGKKPEPTDSLYMAFRRSVHRGIINMDMGLVQAAGNLSAAAGNLAARSGLSQKAGDFAHKTDAYMQLLDELRVVAQERENPIHTEDESFARTLLLDAAEASPAAIVSMTGFGGMALASASGIGSGMAEVRRRTADGDISLQTAAGLVGFGAQVALSELFARGGGRVFEATMGRFVRERLAGATGSFSLKALGVGGKFSKETFRNLLDNRTGRGLDLLAQESAARLEGVASNIDWSEYGGEFTDVELNIREAARSLPYILIGSGRASLHHFRDPHALVADGAELSRWGVPEDVQRRLMNETDPIKQNTLLYDALHNGTRWGGMGFLEDAGRSLRLLHTERFRPFHEKDVVRDFLQLPGETEAARARVLTLGDPKDPAYVEEMVKKHSGGAEIKDPKKALPFLLMTEAWTQRAYPKDLAGNFTAKELAPPELVKLGDHSPAAEKARAEALNKTVRYLDALSYRLLLHSASYSTLTFSGRKPAEVGAEMDALRHKLIGKVAESVLARAGGATPAEASQIFGQFLTDYYGRMRFSSSVDSWIRFVPPEFLSEYHTRALSVRAMSGGLTMRRAQYPELVRSYEVPQGAYHCVESLLNLIGHQEDFRTALSRGMTPQEAYAHLLHRELGDRLSGDQWLRHRMAEDVTDRAAFHENNRRMADVYTRLTGNDFESREGDDGRTYWRIRKPDRHFTRWHDSKENCINDLAADCRVRFLPLGGSLPKELISAHDEQGRYDAARIGGNAAVDYSYFDRLSARATGDMIRFWQEDAALSVPGAVVEPYRGYIASRSDTTHPQLKEHPDFPGAWVIDSSGVKTPFGLAHGRFHAYWLNQLNSGWLTADAALDFLQRRGAIDAERRQAIEKRGRRVINGHRSRLTPEEFFSEDRPVRPKPYLDISGMRGLVARHLADYTSSYFMAHLNEVPMPESAREWFALSPFRFRFPLFKENNDRLQKGRNGTEQVERWTHQLSAEMMVDELRKAEQLRERETGEQPLKDDPLFPMLKEALQPAPSRSAEQGWAYSLGGPNALLRVSPESWNLLQEPVRGWSLLGAPAQVKLHKAFGGKTLEKGEQPSMPKALEELDTVLRQYPNLHHFSLFPGDASRIVQMDIPRKSTAGYRRFDSIFDHPTHDGDRIIHGGFRLQEAKNLPDFFRTDERVMPAMHTLDTLRRAVHDFPYADARGVWWNGERYGGKDGKKLVGMDESWYVAEPMANIRRIFREMPEDGSSVMDFADKISFGRRESLPDDAFLSTTVYRSPNYPLSQIRLMPGERESGFLYARHPYVTHSFIGAPMHGGRLTANNDSYGLYFSPLEEFRGDVTREMIGHMAGWWGKQTVKSSLEMLMDRTASPEQLQLSHHEDISNRELLMQLTEDCRFSASLEGRAPHELNAEEALAATWFHAFAEYETGTKPAQAAKDLFRIHKYFEKHPNRLEAVEAMLNDHRVWYELDPNDQWYHVVTATPEIRRAKRIREELERREWLELMRNRMQREAEFDAIDFANRVGKPKKPRRTE